MKYNNIFQSIKMRWYLPWFLISAILLSSLFFGILHIQYFLGVTVVGMLLCVVYIKTGKLIVSIICHALWNTIIEVNMLSSGDTGMAGFEATPELLDFGIFLLLISLPFILTYIFKYWPTDKSELPYYKNSSPCDSEGVSQIDHGLE